MVNSESDLLGNFIENTQAEIVDSIMEVSATNNIQELKNFLKNHFAVRVITDSMKNKLRTGDIVAARKVRRFSRYNIGDIIVFIRDGVKIVHEIVNIKYENFKIKYETKGINNLNPDNKLVTKKNILGKVVMSTKNLDILLDLVRQGKMTMYDAFGMEIGKSPKSNVPAEIWVIERARTVATGMELMGFQLKMSQQEFTIACIEANKKGIRDLTTVQFRFEHLEDYGGCGRIFWSSIDGFESRINNCPMCATKNSEDITRIIADHIFGGMIKDGLNFEKDIKLLRFIDKAKLSNYRVLRLAHVDMYVTLKINDEIYHLAIEHDGKQHDQNDPHGALNAYLGIQARNGRFTTQEVNQILADRRSTDYKKYMAELKKVWERDNAKDKLFSDLKEDDYYLIRVPAYKVSGIENIQKYIIREFLDLTKIDIPFIYFNPNKL